MNSDVTISQLPPPETFEAWLTRHGRLAQLLTSIDFADHKLLTDAQSKVRNRQLLSPYLTAEAYHVLTAWCKKHRVERLDNTYRKK